jgi:hypothetical protein
MGIASGQTEVHELHLDLQQSSAEDVQRRYRTGGDAEFVDDMLALTADLQGRAGWAWAKTPTPPRMEEEWTIEMDVRVHGGNPNMFGDGMAMWLTPEPLDGNADPTGSGQSLGGNFGMPSRFEGLGIFLDTFDNAPGRHSRRFPYISGRFHSVTDTLTAGSEPHAQHGRVYEHNTIDFAHEMDSADGCSEAFRSADGRRGAMGPRTLTLRLQYEGPPAGPEGQRKGGLLVASVLVAETRRQSDTSPAHTWKQCFVMRGVSLPPGLFLGFSASTGDLTDAHELDRVRVYAPEHAPQPRRASSSSSASATAAAEGDAAQTPGHGEMEASADTTEAAASCQDRGPLCGIASEAGVDEVVRKAASIRSLSSSIESMRDALKARSAAVEKRVEEGAARLEDTLSKLQRTEEELEGKLEALRERAAEVERIGRAEARRRGSLWEIALGLAVVAIGGLAVWAVHLASQAHEKLGKVHSM